MQLGCHVPLGDCVSGDVVAKQGRRWSRGGQLQGMATPKEQKTTTHAASCLGLAEQGEEK